MNKVKARLFGKKLFEICFTVIVAFSFYVFLYVKRPP